MRCGVVIVAAGRGERLGRPERKAMVPLGGAPLVVRTAEAFGGIEAVEEIVLVLHPEDQAALAAQTGLLERLGVTRMVSGGARRQDSVLEGLRALTTEGALVHDAARPFVSAETVARVAGALDEFPGAVPVVPLTSTVKRVAGDGVVRETVPREDLALAQTPQAGRRRLLIDALEDAARAGVEVTDDVQALERLGHAVVSISDRGDNIKITTPADLDLAQVLWEKTR